MSNWKTCEKHKKKYDADKYPDGCYNCTHPEAQLTLPKPQNELSQEVKFTFALTAVQTAAKIMEAHIAAKNNMVDFDKLADSIYEILKRLAK